MQQMCVVALQEAVIDSCSLWTFEGKPKFANLLRMKRPFLVLDAWYFFSTFLSELILLFSFNMIKVFSRWLPAFIFMCCLVLPVELPNREIWVLPCAWEELKVRRDVTNHRSGSILKKSRLLKNNRAESPHGELTPLKINMRICLSLFLSVGSTP